MTRRRLAVAAALAGCATAITAPTFADAPQPTATPSLVVVSKQVNRPQPIVRRTVRFIPYAAPTRAQAMKIIAVESHGSSYLYGRLVRRIQCESSFEWWQDTGGHLGLGQFASETFRRGMRSIGSRAVRFTEERSHMVPSVIEKRWSDGRITRARGGLHRQRIRVTHAGIIPRYPPQTHGWAQVRIMRQAMQGRSAVADSEWTCG
jgi:hypothetical protein